jgi:DNA-binding transcriptional regulator YhcF (GntR family)
MTDESQSHPAPGFGSRLPWTEIAQDLEADILYRTIQPGTRLASIRARAKELGVSDVKVQYAYRSLAKRNLLFSHSRAGTRVGMDAAASEEVRRLASSLTVLALDSGLDLRSLEGTIRGAWRQLAPAIAANSANQSSITNPTTPDVAETPAAIGFGDIAEPELTDRPTPNPDRASTNQDAGTTEDEDISEEEKSWRDDAMMDSNNDFS